jgi:membrane protein DedA with SNARE-associated domain
VSAPVIAAAVVEAAKPLPGVFHHLEGTLHDWGYLAVAGFIFLEDFGVPLPGETMLIAASLYAGTGHLNILAVAAIAFAAAVAGDNVGYGIGRFGGHGLVVRHGKWLLITRERLARAESFFERHGGKVVTGARFVEGLRQLNGIIAGVTEMHWARFLMFNALGAALWVTVWTSLGYVAGDHVETVAHYIGYVGVAVVVVIVAALVWHVRRRRRDRTSEPSLEEEREPEAERTA